MTRVVSPIVLSLLKNLHMKFIAIISFAFFSMGCSHYYYVPNGPNVPLFKEKGEIKANVKLSSADDFDGVEAQAAYSVTNHIAIIANYMQGGSGSLNRQGQDAGA